MVIGICGKYCSGKSTLAKLFIQHGFIEIDVDALGHRALEIHKQTIIKAFNNISITKNNTIDRKLLASHVFSDKTNLSKLEAIVHPWMKEQVKKQIEQNKGQNCVICAALLLKMELHFLCDSIILVKTPLFIRILRAKKRDSLPLKKIVQRIKTQKNLFNKKTLKNTAKTSDISYVWGVYSAKHYEKIFAHYLKK